MVDMNDPIIQLHLSMAEMKGMLSTVITTHAERMESVSIRLDAAEKSCNDNSLSSSVHDVKISNINLKIDDMQDKQDTNSGRTLSFTAIIVSCVVGLFSILKTTGVIP